MILNYEYLNISPFFCKNDFMITNLFQNLFSLDTDFYIQNENESFENSTV
jgi:hypothetical protein